VGFGSASGTWRGRKNVPWRWFGHHWNNPVTSLGWYLQWIKYKRHLDSWDAHPGRIMIRPKDWMKDLWLLHLWPWDVRSWIPVFLRKKDEKSLCRVTCAPGTRASLPSLQRRMPWQMLCRTQRTLWLMQSCGSEWPRRMGLSKDTVAPSLTVDHRFSIFLFKKQIWAVCPAHYNTPT